MASGKPNSFNEGEVLYSNGSVTEVVQIGYLISANINDELYLQRMGQSTTNFSVSIKVDR